MIPPWRELKTEVLGARALVIASPTYKAAYTGLLKLFLDQFDAGELHGIPTAAVMTGGSLAHAARGRRPSRARPHRDRRQLPGAWPVRVGTRARRARGAGRPLVRARRLLFRRALAAGEEKE